jgi:hypothetical protein
MIPAEEGLFKKKQISVSKAKDAKSLEQMKSNMYGEEPVIHLTGSDSEQLARIFKKMKKSGWGGSIASGINAANGYSYASYNQSKDVKNSGEQDAMKYKLVELSGESYLVFKGYELVK